MFARAREEFSLKSNCFRTIQLLIDVIISVPIGIGNETGNGTSSIWFNNHNGSDTVMVY